MPNAGEAVGTESGVLADTYEGETFHTVLSNDGLEAIRHALVHLGIDLEGLERDPSLPAFCTLRYQEGR